MSQNRNIAQQITLALGGKWYGTYGTACCPAHQDTTPSLSLSNGRNGKLLAHCHAGCRFDEIMAALFFMGLIKNGRGIHYEQFPSRKLQRVSNEQEQQQKTRSAIARQLWHESRAIGSTLAEQYLRRRGIICALPESLRFHGKCRHPSGKYYPAMIARIDGGEDFSIHQTYLSEQAAKADAIPQKAMLGPILGGAVHLCTSHVSCHVICEGIETGLAHASGLLSEPVAIWAALSTSGMERLELPERNGRLIAAMDGDNADRKAGLALAERAYQHGFRVFTVQAPQGKDFNDVLLSRKEASHASQ